MILQILLRVGFGHRPAQNGKILTEHIDQTAIDRAPARDHTIARRLLFFHAKIGAAVGDEHIEFFKTALVQQQINPFPRGQLAAPVLRIDPLLPAAQSGGVAAIFELGQDIFHGGTLL